MPDIDLFRCTEATGACEGLRVAARGATVTVSAGFGYVGGVRVEGGWRINVGRERGWRFVQVAPDAGFVHPQEVQGALVLAAVRVERGEAVALRDVRARLCAWRWLGPVGALAHHAEAQEVVTRVQGAVQVGGLWEQARAFAPWYIGDVLEAGGVRVATVRFDKPPLAATGMILETVGIVK